MQKEAVTIASVEDVADFIDAQPTSRNAWLVVVIALGGVFVDAYDFASLGIGVVQLRQEFDLTPFSVGSVTAMMAGGRVFRRDLWWLVHRQDRSLSHVPNRSHSASRRGAWARLYQSICRCYCCFAS